MMKMRRAQGFTLVEIMISIAIIGMMALIAIPNYMNARQSTQRGVCIMNLQMLSTAKDLFADDNELATGTSVDLETDLVPQYIKTNPECPAGGAYAVGAVGEAIICSHDGNQLIYPEGGAIPGDDELTLVAAGGPTAEEEEEEDDATVVVAASIDGNGGHGGDSNPTVVTMGGP